MKSKVIALSAVSSAFVAIFLTLGAYIELFDLIAVVIASAFVILPSYLDSRTGCLMAYFVGGFIGFLFSGFNIISIVFPAYFAFFGLMPVINLFAKKLNKKLWFVIKLVWGIAVAYLLLWYYTAVMSMPIEYTFEMFGETFDLTNVENIYYIFLGVYGVFAVIFFAVYDRFVYAVKFAEDKLLKRIIKK